MAKGTPVAVPRQVGRRSLLVTPRGSLVAGASVDSFRALTTRLLHEGHRHLIVDLSSVEAIDEAGLAAVADSSAAARRIGSRVTLASLPQSIRSALSGRPAARTLEVADSIEAARRQPPSPRALVLGVSALALAASLVALGSWWPGLHDPLPDQASPSDIFWFAGTRVLELTAAALIGFVVTAVHHHGGDRHMFHASIEQAQVLLCVSGAMMMIIIGDSLARAFGMVGAAGIIRFRTPVENPRDVTILFLLMGLGMASGIGALAVAGLGMLFLCAVIVVLDRLQSGDPADAMVVTVTAGGLQFPGAHVSAAFARHGTAATLIEVSPGDPVTARYLVSLPASVSPAEVDDTLEAGGTHGVAAVAWQPLARGG